MALRSIFRVSSLACKVIATPLPSTRIHTGRLVDSAAVWRSADGSFAKFSPSFEAAFGSWSVRGLSTTPTEAQPNPLTQAPQSGEGAINPLAAGADGGGEKVERPLGSAGAILRNAKISPRKLKLCCDLVRFQPVDHAIIQCNLSAKKGSKIIKNVIISAVANATHNHGLDKEKLIVGLIKADKGRHLKRIDIKGRGKTGLLKRYRSHLTVQVREVEDIFAGLPEEKRLVIHKDKGPRKRRMVPL